MRTLFIVIITTMLTASKVSGQVNPMVLSDHQAMVRVDEGKAYLLLPVQEKEEYANVRMIVGNESVRSFNVRLAVDKVDYYVPLKVSGGELLDISFHGDRRTTGAVREFACWREMKRSDSFDTSNRERFRPLYHHTPSYGWMNDPNGMFYKDGVWHLYYQFNPYGSQWENMTWGHSTSKDLLHWESQPTAIEADALGTIFSGSCVVDKKNTAGFGEGAVIAFYTSAGQSQTQSMAYSTDNGRTFTKYAKNPVLVSDVPDFRDPKAFWNPEIQKWNLILAAGQEMRIYSSPNLKDWTYESSFGTGYGNHDGVWECPDLIKLQVRGTDRQKWMLICNINPGGPFGGSATQYFVGDFDGKTFTCSQTDTRWMDYGKDHYATVTFDNAPDGRKVAIAWMSNWQYANQVPTQQYRSANSVPRDLDLFEYKGETYCGVTPSKELTALRRKATNKLSPTCELVIDMKGNADITLSNSKGEQLTMQYDETAGTFSMDRTQSGEKSFSEAFPAVTVAPTHGAIKQLRVFIDHCSVEAFDAEGKMAMTNLVFPSMPYDQIKVKGGKFTVYPIL